MTAKSSSPWKTLSSTIKYRNQWAVMKENQVIRPDKKPGVYGFLEIPDGVGVVALSPDRKIHLIGEWRYPINKYSWSIICGTREKKETPIATAKRELEEEAGLVSGNWKKIGIIHPSPGLVKETAHLFLAKSCRPKKHLSNHKESTEDFVTRLVTFDEAITMIKREEITDSYAVCSILLARDQLAHEK